MAGQRRETLIDVNREGFLQDLSKALAVIRVEAKADMYKVAVYAQNRMRELCPSDTGRLRASLTGGEGAIGPGGIKESVDALGVVLEVGTHVGYAVFVEFGTSKMRAQPFLRPAMAETAARFGQIMAGGSIAGTSSSIGRAKPLFLKRDPGGTHGGKRVGPPAPGVRSVTGRTVVRVG